MWSINANSNLYAITQRAGGCSNWSVRCVFSSALGHTQFRLVNLLMLMKHVRAQRSVEVKNSTWNVM